MAKKERKDGRYDWDFTKRETVQIFRDQVLRSDKPTNESSPAIAPAE